MTQSAASPVTDPAIKTGLIDIVKYRWLNIGFSLLLLIPGIFFMIYLAVTQPDHAPLKLGIDFTGGTILEYGFHRPVTQSDLPTVHQAFESFGYEGSVIQIQHARADALSGTATASTEKAATSDVKTVVSIRSKHLQGDDAAKIMTALQKRFGPITLLQKNSIGPTMAAELLTNGLMALLLAYVLIVGYLSLRFQFDYAISAMIALVHDTLVVLGIFAILGYFMNIEIDSLFITGILTVVGFSIHDTIVVFDRLRENTKVFHARKLPFEDIVNISVNQTLTRSINTSLTALLTLLALYFFGGETTQNFVLVMLLGIAIGTYSSIFVASLILCWWRQGTIKSPARTQAAA